MGRFFGIVVAVTLGGASAISAWAAELAPTGTLRATFPALNPVQAKPDPATGELRGPAVVLTREIAWRLGVPFKITGLPIIAKVIDSVKRQEADIGFIAFDPARAVDVAFSQTFAHAHSSFLVRDNSALRSVADVDRAGVRVGVAARSANDLALTRTLRNAELKRNPGGDVAAGARMLMAGEIDAYASLRHILSEAADRVPGLRILPDNFNTTEQSIIVSKTRASQIEFIDRVIDDARSSGLIRDAIAQTGLKGVDVAPLPPRPGI